MIWCGDLANTGDFVTLRQANSFKSYLSVAEIFVFQRSIAPPSTSPLPSAPPLLPRPSPPPSPLPSLPPHLHHPHHPIIRTTHIVRTLTLHTPTTLRHHLRPFRARLHPHRNHHLYRPPRPCHPSRAAPPWGPSHKDLRAQSRRALISLAPTMYPIASGAWVGCQFTVTFDPSISDPLSRYLRLQVLINMYGWAPYSATFFSLRGNQQGYGNVNAIDDLVVHSEREVSGTIWYQVPANSHNYASGGAYVH